MALSQSADSKPRVCAAADLSLWLHQLNAQLDGALADLAHTMGSIRAGTYAEKANNQQFGLVQAHFSPDAAHLAAHAIDRSAETCFRSVIANFISFLDKLIAFQLLAEGGIVLDREFTQLEKIYEYLNARVTEKIAFVASDTSLSNPKKLARFDGLSEVAKRAALGYFALRRCIEHHQGIAQEEIHVSVWLHKLFIDNIEVTELPAHCREGQNVQYRLIGAERVFAKGSRVTLSPQDVHSIVFALRGPIAVEVFNLHAARFPGTPPATLQHP